jgi:hypothetical protein
MNAVQIKASLQEIKRSFRHLLEDGSQYVIDLAVAEVDATKRQFELMSRQTHSPNLVVSPWGYRIYPEQPLRFKLSPAIKGVQCWVDVYCTMLWADEGELPVKQDIHVRVWWSDLDAIFRPEWDSETPFDKLADARVMLRYHFDLANPNQEGPRYHVQAGGNAREDEFCWFPENLSLPRLPYPPMDLVLICQLIAANFYGQDYQAFRESAEWKGTLRKSQAHLLRGYYAACAGAIEREEDLLDHLWNG